MFLRLNMGLFFQHGVPGSVHLVAIDGLHHQRRSDDHGRRRRRLRLELLRRHLRKLRHLSRSLESCLKMPARKKRSYFY